MRNQWRLAVFWKLLKKKFVKLEQIQSQKTQKTGVKILKQLFASGSGNIHLDFVPMKIDCLYELFVTHLGCSLFKPKRMVTISNYIVDDSNHCSFTCLKCRGLTRASNIFNDFELRLLFSRGLTRTFQVVFLCFFLLYIFKRLIVLYLKVSKFYLFFAGLYKKLKKTTIVLP